MKKLISVILALALVFSVASPVFAADASENTAYNGNPVVIVRGIDFAGLTYEDGSKALSVDAGSIISLMLTAFMTKMKVVSEEALVDVVLETVKGVFEPISCDNEGNSIYPVSMVQYPLSMANYPEFTEALTDGAEPGIVKTAIEKYGAENTYFFTYDWRKTPEQVAGELAAMIETAKADSGKDKVNIVCASMGCMVTTAYLYYHGSDSVESAVYLSGAHNGTYVCGDALNGRVGFDKDILLGFVDEATGGNIFLNIFLTVFDALGVVDFIVDFGNYISDNYYDRANDVVLRDCLGTLSGFWALCPDADFDGARETIFGGHEDEYPVFLEKLDKTREFVMSTEAVLSGAMANGVKISFVSNYNKALIPVYDRANVNGDSVLEAELTSNFATFALLGQTLTDEQLQDAEREYISPDKVINASTAVFKNNTWFVKDAPHVAADYGTGFSEFTFTLLESDTQPTISSFEEYPQFMIADEALSLTPLS